MDNEQTPRAHSPKRVFLSYGHDEWTSFALHLKEDLEAMGHAVWFDADRIKPGEDWERYIEDGLAWASESPRDGRFVLLMTPHSVRRPDGFCLNELSKAITLNLKVIPIMLDWCEPPLSICRIQWLDMQDCLEKRGIAYRDKLNTLLEALEYDDQSFGGPHSLLLRSLKPLSFDAEVRQNMDRFVGRTWILEAIKKWLCDPGAQRIFWITGSPGVGKTSVSAWLCLRWPGIAAFHFCRHDNVHKIDPRRCIMSLAYQLSTQLPEYEERLKRLDYRGIEDLNSRALFDMLFVQPLSGRFPRPNRDIVILIDGLDEATVNGKNELAGFIASEFERTPDWLRLIITSRPDSEVVGPLQAYTPFPIQVNDLRNEQDICKFLAKEMGEGISSAIVKKVANKCDGLFIYAEWVIRELKYGRLSLDHIENFPRGLGGIYLKSFERRFPDVNKWESHTRPALEVIAASQEPMEVKGLASIFKWNVHEERAFKRSLGSLFIVDGSNIHPFHSSLMEWLTDESKEDPYFISIVEGHRILGTSLLSEYHMGSAGWGRPMVKYLPLHLCMAGMREELELVLRDAGFLRSQWEKDEFNVMHWWAIVEEHTDLRMVNVFKPLISSPEPYDKKDLDVVANILYYTLHLEESLRIYLHLVEYYRGIGQLAELQKNLGKLVLIMITMSDYDRAMPFLEEQEHICRDSGNLDGLQRSLSQRAEILWKKNDFNGSLALLQEQERICRQTGNIEGLQESLDQQSTIHRVKGNLQLSLDLLKEQERICRQTGNIEGLTSSLMNQALTLKAWGDLDNALALLKEAESLSRKVGDKYNAMLASNTAAQILRWRGDLDGAIAISKNAERLCRESKFSWGLWECLLDLAVTLRLKGDLDNAAKTIEELQKICTDTGNLFGIQSCLGNTALILRVKDDLDGSLSLHREEERICREIGHKRDLAMSLSNQAVIHRLKGNLSRALELHKESERSLREINYRYGLQECLGEEALTLYAIGDTDAALACLKEQEKICMEMKLKPDLDKCLARQKVIGQVQFKCEKEGMEVKAYTTIK